MNEQLARALASANQIAAERRAELEEARKQADALDARITEARGRQQAITRTRLEGEGTPEEAAEFSALAGDIQLLTELHQEAKAKLLPLGQAMSAAEANVHRQTEAWGRHQEEEAFKALSIRTAEIEALLIKAVRAQHEAGKAMAGHQLVTQSWRPTQDLEKLFRLHVLPA